MQIFRLALCFFLFSLLGCWKNNKKVENQTDGSVTPQAIEGSQNVISVIRPAPSEAHHVRLNQAGAIGYMLRDNKIFTIARDLSINPAFDQAALRDIKARNLIFKQGILFFNATEPFVLPGETKGCILGYVDTRKDDQLRCLDKEAILLDEEHIRVHGDDIYYVTNNYILKKTNGQGTRDIAKQVNAFEVKDELIYHDYLRRLNVESRQGHEEMPVDGLILALKTFPDGNVYAYKMTPNGTNEIVRVADGTLEAKPWVLVNDCRMSEFLTSEAYGIGVSKQCIGVMVYYPKFKEYKTTLLSAIDSYYLAPDNTLFLSGVDETRTVSKLVVLSLDTGKEQEILSDVVITKIVKVGQEVYYAGLRVKDNKQVIGVIGKEAKELPEGSYTVLTDEVK